MSTGYSGRTWKCPYFKSDARKTVRCVGGNISFDDLETFRAFAGRYCANAIGWQDCGIALALTEEYERKDRSHGH